MLQSIRDNAQGWLAWVIVGLISIPFALWGVHEYLNPSGDPVMAEINGEELTTREFQEAFQEQIRRLRAQFRGQDFNLAAFEGMLKQQTLDSLITERVLLQTAMDAGMRISNPVLQTHIHELPYFQEEGQFSLARYQQLLTGQNMSPAAFEADIRRGLVLGQLEQGVRSSSFSTASEQQQRVQIENQQRLISYLHIPNQRFAETTEITDEAVQQHFDENQSRYMEPEKVSIEYVELKQDNLSAKQAVDEALLRQRYKEQQKSFTTPQEWQAAHILIEADDSNQDVARQQAEEILAKVRAGEDFAALAKEFSADTGSAQEGGYLGWFGPGTMVAPFEAALQELKPGETSDLVQTRYGFHIIQLQDAKPETVKSFEDVREQLAQAYREEEAETQFYGQMESFANLAFENPNSLDVLADTMGLEKQDTVLFSRQESGIGILANPKVRDAAFSTAVLKEGQNSEVLELDSGHILVLRLKEHEMAKPKPLEEVKDAIRTELTEQKLAQAAEELGKTLLDGIKEGKDPLTLASEHDLEWATPVWLKRRAPEFKYPAILRSAFRMGHPAADNSLYQGQSLEGGDYALIALLAAKPGVDDNPEQVRNTARQAWSETEYQLLLDNLKARAQIKINQAQLDDNAQP